MPGLRGSDMNYYTTETNFFMGYVPCFLSLSLLPVPLSVDSCV